MNEDRRSAEAARRKQLEEETRQAADYGMSPRRPISTAANFRVEGLTRLAPHPQSPTSMLPQWMRRVVPAAPRLNNPFLPPTDARALRDAIEARLDQRHRQLSPGLQARLLDELGDLAAHSSNAEQVAETRRRVFAALFGEDQEQRSEGGRAGEGK